MRILLRLLILMLLLLSAASLVFGIILFNERELLKARIHVLEFNTVELSKLIEKERPPDLIHRQLPKVNLRQKELKSYYRRGPDGKPVTEIDPRTQKKRNVTKGPGTMDEKLTLLQAMTQQQLDVLDDTRIALRNTRNDLSHTMNVLRDTKGALAGAMTEIERLKDDLADEREQTITLNVKVDNLNDQIADLSTQIEEKNTEIANLQDKHETAKKTINMQDHRIAELNREIATLKSSTVTPTTMTAGTKGTILTVNPEYNFVVIGVLPDSKLMQDARLVVRRKTELIAKVSIREVKDEENIAIADIMNEWQQKPIQKGDYVDYVKY